MRIYPYFLGLLGAALLSAAVCTTTVACQAQPMSEYQADARFLAGIRTPGGPLAGLESSPAWIRFAQYFDESWREFDGKQLSPMREWAAQALAGAASAETPVFYPFGGPDFVNVHTLFPRGRAYLMVALDPLGEIPDFASMDDRQLEDFYANLRRSLQDLVHRDFFVTREMEVTLAPTGVGGVLPVILFFMARMGDRIMDVQYWLMRPDGTVEEVPARLRQPIPQAGVTGLRLVFTSGGSDRPQTLYYLRLNLDNRSLSDHPRVVSFLEGFTPATTFVKAGSYLMFSRSFRDVARFILDHSDHVLQTASGIPFRDFEPSVWKIDLFGSYTGPIDLFRGKEQPDLVEAYKRGVRVEPLPFGIGYHFRPGTSNLLFASRRRP